MNLKTPAERHCLISAGIFNQSCCIYFHHSLRINVCIMCSPLTLCIMFHAHACFFTASFSGDGFATDSVRRAAGSLQPGHVLPGPAETVHQRQERPDTSPSQIETSRQEHADMKLGRDELNSLCLRLIHWMLLLPPAGS